MSNLHIQRQLNLPQPAVREAAQQLAEKLQREYGVVFTWQGDCADIKGPSLQGRCDVSEGKVDIQLSLGLLAAAFAGKIEEKINQQLDKLSGE